MQQASYASGSEDTTEAGQPHELNAQRQQVWQQRLAEAAHTEHVQELTVRIVLDVAQKCIKQRLQQVHVLTSNWLCAAHWQC